MAAVAGGGRPVAWEEVVEELEDGITPFFELIVVVGRLAALYNLHSMLVSMRDEFNNISWDCWHGAAIRRFEVNKIGSRITLSKL